jgi:hypothetical protein
MIISHSRGHEIYYNGKEWRYRDTNEICNDDRPCKKCGRYPTVEGYDACLGHVFGAKSACCGHGVENGYVVR